MRRSLICFPDKAEAAWVEEHVRALAGLEAEAVRRRRPRARGGGRLAPVPRGAGRPSSAGAGVRGHALGRRRAARLHRPPRGLGERRARCWSSARPGRSCSTDGGGWGGGKRNALTIALSPLADADIARLIGTLLEQAVLPAETQVDASQDGGRQPALCGGVRAHADRPRPPAAGGRPLAAGSGSRAAGARVGAGADRRTAG